MGGFEKQEHIVGWLSTVLFEDKGIDLYLYGCHKTMVCREDPLLQISRGGIVSPRNKGLFLESLFCSRIHCLLNQSMLSNHHLLIVRLPEKE